MMMSNVMVSSDTAKYAAIGSAIDIVTIACCQGMTVTATMSTIMAQ